MLNLVVHILTTGFKGLMNWNESRIMYLRLSAYAGVFILIEI
jgi:hypothetical protein